MSTPVNNIPAIQVTDLKKVYGSSESEVRALRGFSATFLKGSFTAIMGPSGSGKSTLLQCAAGLDRPTSGSVKLAGNEITTLSETELTLLRRDHIGFVFQAFNLMPSLTAAQNVELPLRLAGKTPEKETVITALRQVGLENRAGHLPSQLSGGQQQRIAIARALVSRPGVLFADEPTGALDSKNGKEVMTMVQNLVDSDGQTVIMVTHDPVIASYADSVLFLADGQFSGSLQSPSPEAIVNHMATLEA